MERHCGDCGKLCATEEHVCAACGEIVEEAVFLRWVVLTTVLAGLFHFVMGRLGVPGRGWILETLMTESLLILLLYGASKVWQKIRNPQRRVFDEFASVFSDRLGRLLLLATIVSGVWYGWILVPLILEGRHFAPRAGEPSWFTGYREIRGLILLVFVPPIAILAAWRQGVRFFDPRVACTYARRHDEAIRPESTTRPESTPYERGE